MADDPNDDLEGLDIAASVVGGLAKNADLNEKLGKGEVFGLLGLAAGFLLLIANVGLGGLAWLLMAIGGVVAARSDAKKKGKTPGFVLTVLGPILGVTFLAVVIVVWRGGSQRPHEAAGTPAIPAPAIAAPVAQARATTLPAAAPEDTPDDDSTTAVAPAAARAAYRVGDLVRLEDSDWKVLSARRAGRRLKATDGFSDPATTEGQFVIVKFEVKNTGSAEDSVMDEPKLVDARGREFSAFDSEDTYIPDGAKSMGMAQLQPSMRKAFWEIFEVPADATGLKFKARTLAAFGDEVPIALGF